MINILRFLVKYLPTSAAARITIFFAMFPMVKPELKQRDSDALKTGQRFTFKSKGMRVAYSWGEGPLIILIHGWEGRGAQMAPLAQRLAECGFKAIIFDVKAHGESSGKRVDFTDFQEDIIHLTQHMNQSVHAYVAHSAGGLLMMTARHKKLIQAERYVTLASPRGPYPPLEIIRKFLRTPESVEHRCRHHISKNFSASWSDLMKGKMFEYHGQGELLVIHDQDDELVLHSDSEQVIQQWPNAQTMKTSGLGHNKLLWSPSVMERIEDFIT